MAAKQQTIEQFITKAISKHGDNYDYSEVIYSGFKVPVKIICRKHLEIFEVAPWKHLAGAKCPLCSAENRRAVSAHTKDSFIVKAIIVHGDRYDYSKVTYLNNSTDVEIICCCHGVFTQQPANHMQGKGCPKCAIDKVIGLKRLSKEEFVQKAIQKHGNKYTYDKVEYKNNSTKIIITCTEHGDFKQSPAKHLRGSGCPSCTKFGYRKEKPGFLYILSCGDVTKVGITNSSPSVRANYVSRSFGAEFSVVASWKWNDGSIPYDIETQLLRELRSKYDQPTEKFDGSSECFFNVDLELLLQRINELSEMRT